MVLISSLNSCIVTWLVARCVAEAARAGRDVADQQHAGGAAVLPDVVVPAGAQAAAAARAAGAAAAAEDLRLYHAHAVCEASICMRCFTVSSREETGRLSSEICQKLRKTSTYLTYIIEIHNM